MHRPLFRPKKCLLSYKQDERDSRVANLSRDILEDVLGEETIPFDEAALGVGLEDANRSDLAFLRLREKPRHGIYQSQ